MKKREKTFVENEIENEQQKSEKKPDNKISFRQVFASLPPVLMTVMLKRLYLGIGVFVLTIVAIFVLKDTLCLVGFLISLLSLYMALNIVWEYGDDKIRVARMYVCKSSRRRKGQVEVILRDASITNIVAQDFETYKYTISTASKADFENIEAGTIMDVYISITNPNAIIGYEILGNATT